MHRRRFRQPNDVRPERLYRWYLLSRAADRVVAEPFWNYLRYSAFHKIKSDPARETQALEKIAQKQPRFFCLNDDQGDSPNREVGALVRSFLEKYYPQPSSFEEPGA